MTLRRLPVRTLTLGSLSEQGARRVAGHARAAKVVNDDSIRKLGREHLDGGVAAHSGVGNHVVVDDHHDV